MRLMTVAKDPWRTTSTVCATAPQDKCESGIDQPLAVPNVGNDADFERDRSGAFPTRYMSCRVVSRRIVLAEDSQTQVALILRCYRLHP